MVTRGMLSCIHMFPRSAAFIVPLLPFSELETSVSSTFSSPRRFHSAPEDNSVSATARQNEMNLFECAVPSSTWHAWLIDVVDCGYHNTAGTRTAFQKRKYDSQLSVFLEFFMYVNNISGSLGNACAACMI